MRQSNELLYEMGIGTTIVESIRDLRAGERPCREEVFVGLSSMLDCQAAENPKSPALFMLDTRSEGETVDYLALSLQDLVFERDSWVNRLASQGIGKGDRVMVIANPGLSLISVCYALFKIGAVALIVEPGVSWVKSMSCIRRSRVDCVIGNAQALALSRALLGDAFGARKRIALDGPLERIGSRLRSRAAVSANSRPEDAAAIVFSIGSTGRVKRSHFTHGALAFNARMAKKTFAIGSGEICMSLLSISSLAHPAMGVATAVPQVDPHDPVSANPEQLIQMIRDLDVTSVFGIPSIWKRIVRRCQLRSESLPSVRRVVLGGGTVSPELMKLSANIVPNGAVHSIYGTASSPLIARVSSQSIEDEPLEVADMRGVPIGTPFDGMQVRIQPFADDASEAVRGAASIGERGEILVRREGALDWESTGDVGYADGSGSLRFCGRLSDRIVNVYGAFYSECCERVFNRHPRVARTALIGLRKGGKLRAGLAVEPLSGEFPGSDIEQSRFKAELMQLAMGVDMARFIVDIFFSRTFPADSRTGSKIDRQALGLRFGKKVRT